MSRKAQDMVGKRVDAYVIKGFYKCPSRPGHMFQCQCDCGKEFERHSTGVYSVYDSIERAKTDKYSCPSTSSCGCNISRERRKEKRALEMSKFLKDKETEEFENQKSMSIKQLKQLNNRLKRLNRLLGTLEDYILKIEG